jgi:tetratricopeptide (TPR) repeat protein
MKSEERRRVEENELALWLAKVISRVRPYARVLAWIGGIALVILLGGAIWRTTAGAASARASAAFYQALAERNPAALEDVAKQYPGRVSQLARLAAADLYLVIGCEELFRNKIVAQQELQKALEHYREAERLASDPELRARARFGMARTYEAMAGTRAGQGNLRTAISLYQELIRDFPQSPYASFAEERLAEVQREEIKAFYDRFAQYDPRPELQPEPAASPLPSIGEAIPPEPSPRPETASLPTEPGSPQPSGSGTEPEAGPVLTIPSPGKVSQEHPPAEEKSATLGTPTEGSTETQSPPPAQNPPGSSPEKQSPES